MFFGISVMLSGCYTHRAIGLLQERKDLPQYDSVPYQPYRLQVNDEIIYRVISLDETLLSALQVNTGSQSGYNDQNVYTYRIYSDGTIDLPFLDPIHIEGLTEAEAQDTVQKYMRELIPDAEVKLALSNKQFLVLGDIGAGVRYIYKERMTIYQALAMTGDVYWNLTCVPTRLSIRNTTISILTTLYMYAEMMRATISRRHILPLSV